jgi:predicted DsbA family dithiol-disulfide isomerase
MHITVFSDYICPFCYIGIETLRAVQAEVPPFTLEWKGFQIHPEYPATGLPMEHGSTTHGSPRMARHATMPSGTIFSRWQRLLV